jgi:hypothetical protein
LPALLTYRPTRAQCHARAGGLLGEFLNPAKLICMGFAKNRLAATRPQERPARSLQQVLRCAQRALHCSPMTSSKQSGTRGLAPGAGYTLLALSSYTHRPGRSAAHGPAGFWASFSIPQNSFVWVSLKIVSRSPGPGDSAHEATVPDSPPSQTAYLPCTFEVRSQTTYPALLARPPK